MMIFGVSLLGKTKLELRPKMPFNQWRRQASEFGGAFEGQTHIFFWVGGGVGYKIAFLKRSFPPPPPGESPPIKRQNKAFSSFLKRIIGLLASGKFRDLQTNIETVKNSFMYARIH